MSERSSAQDWVAVALIGGPFLLALSGELLEYRPPWQFNVAIHYSLYLVGLVLAISHFVRDGLGRDTKELEIWFPRLFLLTFVWDAVIPVRYIATFSLLKALFYLLILVQLPSFMFGKNGFFRGGDRPYPLLALLTLIAVSFLQERGATLIGDLETEPFLSTILAKWFLAFVLLFGMLAVPMLMARAPSWLGTGRRRALAVAGAPLALGLALNGFLRHLPQFMQDLGVRQTVLSGVEVISSPLPFSPELPCLYLYLLAYAFYDHWGGTRIRALGQEVGLRGFVSATFAAVFLLVYMTSNTGEIVRAVLRVLEYRQVIGEWGSVALVALSVVTGVVTLVEFYYRNRRADGIPSVGPKA